MRQEREKGFTLIEIMIVVMIIGILLAIAVPNFVRARATSRLQSIEANLKQIDTAIQQWAIEQQKAPGAVVTRAQLDGTAGATSYLAWPSGPVVGNYDVTAVGAGPTFDGGSQGAMDGLTWQTTCGQDPVVCGL